MKFRGRNLDPADLIISAWLIFATVATGTAIARGGWDREPVDFHHYDHAGLVASYVNGNTADVLVPECTHPDGGDVVPCRWGDYAIAQAPSGWVRVHDNGEVDW